MKKKVLVLAFLCGLCCFSAVSPVMAANEWDKEICSKLADEQKKEYGCDETSPEATSVAVEIINVITGVVGVIGVLMIVIGGINYATSSGDPGKTKKAKDTIMYSAIGLVVALMAFALVNFVLGGAF